MEKEDFTPRYDYVPEGATAYRGWSVDEDGEFTDHWLVGELKVTVSNA